MKFIYEGQISLCQNVSTRLDTNSEPSHFVLVGELTHILIVSKQFNRFDTNPFAPNINLPKKKKRFISYIVFVGRVKYFHP